MQAPDKVTDRIYIKCTKQPNKWQYRLFIIENAQVFFQEYSSTQPRSNWAESQLYTNAGLAFLYKDCKTKADAIITFYIMLIWMEIGQRGGLWYPEAPTVAWEE